MNKKRKILTLVALVVFGLIIALHYTNLNGDVRYWHDGKRYLRDTNQRLKMSECRLFVLAVFYAGLFAILGDSKRKE